jgi:hypothetical protein
MHPIAMTALLLLAICAGPSIQAQSTCNCTQKKRHTSKRHVNADLEMAKIYVRLKNWSEAEAHFVLAARDPLSLREALVGLEDARSKVNAEKLAGDAAPLDAAKLFEERDIQSKAEEIYRTTAQNSAIAESTRKAAADGLAKALDAQRSDRWFATTKEWMERIKGWVEFLFWLVALVLGIILGRAVIGSILRRRKIILFHGFDTPSDETSRSLAIMLRQARVRMQNPWLSPVGVMPAVLVQNMPTFDSELEPIEDLELGGAKIPFAAIARIWGDPKVQVHGAFDALSPSGSIFAAIKKRGVEQELYRAQRVRTGVPSQQRGDLFNFAYDVIVRASKAFDDV